MTSRLTVTLLVAALLASLAVNLWLALARATPAAPPDAAARCATASDRHAPSDDASADLAALLRSVAAARGAAEVSTPAPAPPPPAAAAPRAPVDGFAEGRMTRALLDEVQCRIAREKAADAWRKEASALQASLHKSTVASPATHDADLAAKRAQLADVIGVDEGDARVAQTAEHLLAVRDEAKAELHRLMASDPPDWRAALDVVRGLYRQEDGAVLHAFGAAAADDWRMSDVDGRAAALAIGASLVGVPWVSVDDRTPPAWR